MFVDTLWQLWLRYKFTMYVQKSIFYTKPTQKLDNRLYKIRNYTLLLLLVVVAVDLVLDNQHNGSHYISAGTIL